MSQMPLFIGVRYELEFSVEGGAFLMSVVQRSVSGSPVVEIYSDDQESRLQAFMLCATTMRALQHAEGDAKVRVKMLAWREALFGSKAEDEDVNPPPPPTDDIPF